MEWALLGAAAVVAVVLWGARGEVLINEKGSLVEAPFTLVTADRDDIACALGTAVEGYRCEHRAPDKPFPRPPSEKHKLVPYMTTERVMYLVPGLFTQPAVAARYRQEPPKSRGRHSLRRFTARCQVRLVEQVHGFHLRWQRRGGWSHHPGTVWLAEPVQCRVDEP